MTTIFSIKNNVKTKTIFIKVDYGKFSVLFASWFAFETIKHERISDVLFDEESF